MPRKYFHQQCEDPPHLWPPRGIPPRHIQRSHHPKILMSHCDTSPDRGETIVPAARILLLKSTWNPRWAQRSALHRLKTDNAPPAVGYMATILHSSHPLQHNHTHPYPFPPHLNISHPRNPPNSPISPPPHLPLENTYRQDALRPATREIGLELDVCVYSIQRIYGVRNFGLQGE